MSKEYEKIELEYTDHARKAMELMQISDEQVKMVIHHGETTGEKLYRKNEEERFLAKKRIGDRTIYVEYLPTGKGNMFKIYTVYAHKAKIKV